MSGNFWDLSTGESAATSTETEFEIATGNLEPIPDGSTVLAMIDEAKWDQRGHEEYLSLRWTVVRPDQFRNRKVFQKLWITDADPYAASPEKAAKKKDKALRMLAAIDANCGGRLTAKAGRPTDEMLTAALTNKLMAIKVLEWEMVGDKGDTMKGNWVAAVAPKSTPLHVPETRAASRPAAAQKPAAQRLPPASSIEDDEIPF